MEKRRPNNLGDAVLDNVIDGVIAINEQGIIEHFNPSSERIFGYAAHEVIGKNINILMPEPYHSAHDGYMESYITTGSAQIIGTAGREVRAQRKDGSIFPIDLSVSEFELDGTRHFSGIIRDITNRKAVERDARESQERYRALLEASEQVIWVWRDGQIDESSPLGKWWEGATGQPADAIATFGWLEVVHPEDRDRVQKVWENALSESKSFEMEYRLRGCNGKYMNVFVRGIFLYNEDGSMREVIGSLSDITARKEAERAKEYLRQSQKMEALGQLTAGISHDFNNLLAIILGNLDFLHERLPEDSPLQEFIMPSVTAAERGSELTQQLLTFGRKQALQPRLISVNELLNNFQVLVRRTLGERIDIIMALAPDLWSVKADPGYLTDALLNLSVNARDAMPEGGELIYETENVHLDEEYTALNAELVPGEYVRITVSDTGIGMTADIMARAFEPFFTNKEVGKGTGLGLSMVYGFVKQSNGHIRLYSEVGHGTSVSIYLPRGEGKPSTTEIKESKSTTPVAQKDMLILVVEDNRDLLKMTSSMLETLGYSVVPAETGEAAIEILKTRDDIDLLLTDVMLPGLVNGPILAKSARVMHPELKVIFNSGYAEHAIFQQGMLEKGVPLLRKPFRRQQLAETINQVLGS